MTDNKKIKNATISEYNGIKFRSKNELSCYKKLEAAKLDFSYESEKITLWEGFKSSIPIYAPNKIKVGKFSKNLESQTKKHISITYTPDFIVTKGDYKIYIEYKGQPNDTYPIKKKMFLKTLEDRNDGIKYIFIEPHSQRQVLQAIDIINKL